MSSIVDLIRAALKPFLPLLTPFLHPALSTDGELSQWSTSISLGQRNVQGYCASLANPRCLSARKRLILLMLVSAPNPRLFGCRRKRQQVVNPQLALPDYEITELAISTWTGSTAAGWAGGKESGRPPWSATFVAGWSASSTYQLRQAGLAQRVLGPRKSSPWGASPATTESRKAFTTKWSSSTGKAYGFRNFQNYRLRVGVMFLEISSGSVFAPRCWRRADLFGSSGRTRTYNPSVNSRMLYH
jgi:hypothetical protein